MQSEFLETICKLQKEKDERFSEMRSQAGDLISVWRRAHAHLKKDLLDSAFALVDAESSDEISAAKFLRSSLEDQFRNEIDRLELALQTEKRNKYEKKKNKLKNLLQSTHLVPTDIRFDFDKQVEDESLSEATSTIRSKINEVRSSILERKVLVFRVETAREAIENAWPFKDIRVVLEKAKTEAFKVKFFYPDLKYDGVDIAVYLSRLGKAASGVLDATAEAHLHEPVDIIDLERSTTRSGARFFRSRTLREDADPECEVNMNLDWNRTDKKRMLNAVYRVKDLDATIESYQSDFGMTLLRKVECPDMNCTFALVGYGPENNTFALKLECYDDTDALNIGDGFGNIGIGCKVHETFERIKTSGRCRIHCRPASLKNDSTLIAVAQESNGYNFELIEKSPAIHICHLMLRVSDLDKSIKFYEKALGMHMAGRKDLPRYKCSIAKLRYGVAENVTCLELTSNDGVLQYNKGNAFMEITIGTDDVMRSFVSVEKAIQELGGRVLERPAQNLTAAEQQRAVASFEDPDGYKLVMVDTTNFLKEAALGVADGPRVDASS